MSLAIQVYSNFFLEKFKEKEILSKKEIYVCVYTCDIAYVDFV